MNNPLISVVLPVFNCEDYIEQSINSILSQSYKNFELLILNDCSTDSSEKKILLFKDNRIKYFINESNLGLSKTLNKGIKLASGDYIARMDQDDIAFESRFEKQINFLLTHPEIAIVGTAVNVVDGNGKSIDNWHYPTESSEIKHAIYKNCCFAHPTVMFLKSKIVEAGLYNENCFSNEDYELWIRLLKNSSGANLPDILLKYRIHNGQMSSNKVMKQILNCLLIKKEIAIDYSKDLKTQVLDNIPDQNEIEKNLTDSFSFWISLNLKANETKLAEDLFSELVSNINMANKDNKKIINSLNLKIHLKKKDALEVLSLIIERINLLF